MLRRTFLFTAAAARGSAASETRGIRKSPDPRTGREVWQITAGAAWSHSSYFEAQPFTADDRYLVYASNSSGGYQLHRVDLNSGERQPLTHCRDLSSYSYSVHTDGDRVIYLDGSRLEAASVSSGKGATILDLAAVFPGAAHFSAGRTFSRDGRYTAAGCTAGGQAVLALVDLREKKIAARATIPGGTGGHALVCPADPYRVTFVRTPDRQNDMKLPMSERTRTMIADLRTGEIRPYLTMPYGWRATHEYWDAAGERFYWHKKHVPGWTPASICSMKRDGTDWRTHFTSEDLMLGHSMISSGGRFIVSDVQKPGDNPLVRIDLETGRHDILCWPDSSVRAGHARHAHVHPAISRSGRYAAYTSDRTGSPQVYVVPLG